MSELTMSMLIADRSAGKDRKAIIDSAYKLEEKRQKAIKKMGNKWLLHPENRVSRMAEPLPEHPETPMLLKRQAI